MMLLVWVYFAMKGPVSKIIGAELKRVMFISKLSMLLVPM
jgi:hypothetical protein